MKDEYRLIERLPTLEEYRMLCTAVGWAHAINFEAAPRSLEHSLYSVVAVQGEQVVGMGRLVGDGAIYFYVEDIAIHPDHQRRGIGRQIVEALLAFIEKTTTGQVFVGLFSTAEAEHLYEQFDFSSKRDMTGMFRVVEGHLARE